MMYQRMFALVGRVRSFAACSGVCAGCSPSTVPALMSSSVDDNKSETEKAIPLWAEELEINKKMVKVAEIVIRKGRVIEKKKIDVNIKKEVTIKYPDGRTEKL